MPQIQPLPQDCDQEVDAHGDPDLGLYRVLRGAEKRFDMKMLLHPFEEQFHLPTGLVEGGDDMCRKYKVVGDEDQRLLIFGVSEPDAPQSFRVGRCGFHPIGHDNPIRSYAARFVDWQGLDSAHQQCCLGSRDEKRTGLMKSMKTLQVLIATVHDVVRTRLWPNNVQCVDIVDFSVGYVDERRDRAAQVDQRMQFHGCFRPTKLGPRKQLQAEIYSRRIQCVDRLRQIGNSCVLGVQISCLGNQHLGKVSENTPVPILVRISQCRARNRATNTQVVELRRNGAKALALINS